MPTWLDKILNSQFVMIGLAGLAFLIALWLVIVIVRMLTGGRLRMSGGRTRQARLGIVDAFDLDRQRQLIIVRRDNTEHLIMIGGPNDLVIESEIVRVEARESRRMADKGEAFGDNRIPAPFMVADGSAPGAALEEPMLPMPAQAQTERSDEQPALPAPIRAAPPETDPARAPTFPLPPRRPAPLPDRRPPPPPESATRSDERPSFAPAAPAAPALRPVEPTATPEEARPSMPATPQPTAGEPPQSSPPTAGRDDIPPRPPVRTPPSFLKPLPPRPPIRPLRRATPVAPGAPAPSAGESPAPGAASPQVDAPSPPPAPEPVAPAAELPAATKPPEPVAPPPPSPPKAEETNPLESLEEEMAKLLGRG